MWGLETLRGPPPHPRPPPGMLAGWLTARKLRPHPPFSLVPFPAQAQTELILPGPLDALTPLSRTGNPQSDSTGYLSHQAELGLLVTSTPLPHHPCKSPPPVPWTAATASERCSCIH